MVRFVRLVVGPDGEVREACLLHSETVALNFSIFFQNVCKISKIFIKFGCPGFILFGYKCDCIVAVEGDIHK